MIDSAKSLFGGQESNGEEIMDTYDEIIKDTTNSTAEFIAKDLYNEEDVAKFILREKNPISYNNLFDRDVEEDSVFDEKSDSLAKSGGQLAAQIALAKLGVPMWLSIGTTAAGGEMENALNQGATFEEATASAAASAAVEVLTEQWPIRFCAGSVVPVSVAVM